MHTFAQKPKGTQQTKPAKPKTSSKVNLRQSGEAGLSLHLQRTIGNQAVQPRLDANTARVDGDSTTTKSRRFGHDFSRISVYAQGPVMTQAKLTVNTPGDIYEREADRIAEQVMATPACTVVSGAPPRIQRFSGQSNGQTNAVPASVDQALSNPGRPLEPGLRQDMEQRFGYDFSKVRVHTGSLAEQSALDVNANAYTVGHNIVFGVGRYSPGTQHGRRLLAHELAHVVQQSNTGTRACARLVQRAIAEPSVADLEQEWASILDELRLQREVGADLVEQELGNRPKSLGKIEAGLKGVEKRGGAKAEDAKRLRKEIEKLSKHLKEIGKELQSRAWDMTFGRRTSYTADADKAVAKAEKSAVKTTVKAETAAAKTTVKAEAKLGSRVLASAGRLGLSLLLPDPTDAIMLMVQFAGSYQEAWDIIEQRNTRKGIAFGIAAGMTGLDWEWVKQNLWRRFAEPDVATLVIEAVGLAERSFNDGLVRGHKYGAAYPQRMKNRLLVEAFTILAQEGYKTDEKGLFTIDTVGRVARVLMPIADDFLHQAAERKKAREKREEDRARKERKDSGCVGFKC